MTPTTDALQADDRHRFGRWQARVFAAVWITYFAYYLCRLNMTVAKTRFTAEFAWSSADFGKVFTALTLFYAVGQFVNGQMADRFGTRLVATLGVAGSVAMNLAVYALAVTSSPDRRESVLGWLILFWGANGFFQAMGWSPMVRVMAHWFPLAGRGRVMGLLGTCYQFGAAASVLLATFLTGMWVERFGGDWRSVFLVPSLLFAAIGLVFFLLIRNSPADVGLAAVDDGGGGEEPRRTLAANLRATLTNPSLWVVALAFFMLDVNRYGFVNWLPAYVDRQAPGVGAKMITLGIHPLAGSLGALAAGWATDRFFGGRRAPVIVLLLALLGTFSIVFTMIDPRKTASVVIVVALVGFCTYGPHILMVGHAAQDFGRKAGAAGAAGFIDAVGYVGASLAGWGAGKMIDARGYGTTFTIFGIAGFLGAAAACLFWRRGPRLEVKSDVQ